MNLVVVQILFFAISIFFTVRNVHDKFFTYKTTVTYLTKRLSEIDFPVLFSFVTLPGFNESVLEEFGFPGVWYFFSGHDDKSSSLTWAVPGITVEGDT